MRSAIRRWALPFVLLVVTASAAATLYVAIHLSGERNNAILVNCQGQNARHDATIRQLNREYAQALQHADPAKRQQIVASRAPTVLLINALAPKQNCQRVLTRLTSNP